MEVKCPECEKDFRLKYDDYGDSSPQTLKIDYCLSGGIYNVEVICPHCNKRTVIL